MPSSYRTSEGYNLGAWVTNKRYNKEALSSERRTTLEGLTGWVWNRFEADWEEGFTQLQQYVKTHGDALVPGDRSDGPLKRERG